MRASHQIAQYAVGKAYHEHWAILPDSFDERRQKAVCPCGKPLFLTSRDPKEAGYPDSGKVDAILRRISNA